MRIRTQHLPVENMMNTSWIVHELNASPSFILNYLLWKWCISQGRDYCKHICSGMERYRVTFVAMIIHWLWATNFVYWPVLRVARKKYWPVQLSNKILKEIWKWGIILIITLVISYREDLTWVIIPYHFYETRW
jgi:hypothetical protein